VTVLFQMSDMSVCFRHSNAMHTFSIQFCLKKLCACLMRGCGFVLYVGIYKLHW